MVRTLRRLFLFLILLTGTAVTAAVPTVKPPVRPLDLSKLPPNTIIVIGDDAKEALQQPGVIVLTPEKFKEMLDQIEQLKKQANSDKPEAPSRLKICGKVEGEVVTLQLQYEFETRKRRAQVALGGQKVSPNSASAWPTAVALDDGRLPLLPPPGEEGLTVLIDAPGTHKLTLDVELLVTPRGTKGSERGFEIGLPRAAITTIDFLDAADNVAELRCNGRPVPAKDISSRNGQRKAVPLGAADRLEVIWKGPAPQRAQPLQTAVGTLDVRIEESQVTVQGDLSLQMKSGQTATWQILAPPPPQASIEPDVLPGDARAPVVTQPAADAKVPIWTIKLRDPSDEPLKVRVSARQPRAGKNVAVLPFAVVGAVHQNGTLTVSVPPELRFRARPKPEISQRELPEELRKAASNIALFSYWNLPPTKGDQLPAPVLEMDVEVVKGSTEAETTYQLRLTEQGWQVSATFEVTPVRTGIEKLDVDLPSEYELKAGPALLVEPDPEVKDPAAARRIGVLKLAQKQFRPFKVTLEGLCPQAKGAPPALVPLPRVLPTLDRGAHLSVVLPEGTEVASVREPGAEALPHDKQEHTWKLPRSAPRVQVALRARHVELPVESQVDVTLADRQALVRQHIRFLAVPEGMKEVTLHSADLPPERSPIMDGEPLLSRERHTWVAPLPRSATLNLEYSFPLPEPEKGGHGRRFTLPLLWPEGATRAALTRVRVWSDPGTQPLLAGGRWEEQPTEIVPQRDRLPALVLRSSGLEVPLTLTLTEPSGASLATLTVDRTLFQAAVAESGQQTYRARFLLGRIASRHLDLELPVPAGVVNLEVLLDGQGITTIRAVDEDGKESDTGRIARVSINPELYRKPTVLDIRYQLAPSRLDGGNRLQTTLHPPRLRGNVLMGQVRWLVSLPPDWVALCPGSHVNVEQRWGLRGNLPARPSASAADLERWFHAGEPDGESRLPVADLVCTHPGPEPLVLWHATQQAWLLGCSLVFIALGLVLYFAALPRLLFWVVVVALGLGALAAAVLWPSVLPAVAYGCEPGAVVLLVVIGVQWLLHRRYRRQLVFMPGFSRLAPGSSILRSGGSGSRLRGDPSTVDAPH